jgi:hypothetical protein
LALISFFVSFCFSFLSYKIYPLKIAKVRASLFFVFMILFPFFIQQVSNCYELFVLQAILVALTIGDNPCAAVLIKHIPVLKRVTATSFLYATTRAVMYIITTFSLVFLTDAFGHYGLWIITIPVAGGFLWGIRHFEKLENRGFQINIIDKILPQKAA